MKRPRLVGAALSIASLLPFLEAAPARAEEADSVSVTSSDCTFDAKELERLVKLELSSVLDQQGSGQYGVELRCSDDAIAIKIRDPLTRKSLERSVRPPPASQPEPERLLALTVAQLYRAAWLELAADTKGALPPSEPAPRAARVVMAARRAAESTLSPSIGRTAPRPTRPANQPQRPPTWSIGVAGGVRARRLQQPIVLQSLELDASMRPTGRLLWVLVDAGAEWASLSRSAGNVDVVLARGAAGMGVEPLVAGRWSGFAELAAGFAYARIAGRDPIRGYKAGHVAGAGFDGSVALGAALTVGFLRVELTGRSGLLANTPAGRIRGQHDVSLDGPWAGGDLRLHLVF